MNEQRTLFGVLRTGRPRTGLGKWSLRLICVFFVLFPAWLLWVSLVRMDRPDFWSDPVHAVLIICAAAAASASGVTGALAVLWKRERSLRVLAATAVGCFVLWWTFMEIAHPLP
ncbi:MAG: hypothetical protein V3T86_10330 [Planctomycetota bacterium]